MDFRSQLWADVFKFDTSRTQGSRMMSISGGDNIMAVKGTIPGGIRFLAVVSNRRKNRRYFMQGFLWKIYSSRELKPNTCSVQ